jgi:hypothetical protein
MHRRGLAGLSFEHAAHNIVLGDRIAAVEAATAGPSCSPHRSRAVGLVAHAGPESAAGPRAGGRDAGGGTRRHHPFRQSAAVHGLSGSRSFRPSQRKHATPGAITKVGNARRVLIEAAWNYRFPARIGGDLLLRQANPPHSPEGPGATLPLLAIERFKSGTLRQSRRRHRLQHAVADGAAANSAGHSEEPDFRIPMTSGSQ